MVESNLKKVLSFMYRRRCLKLSKGNLTLSVKHFLLGRKFKLETDHRPLKFMFATNKELPKTVSAESQGG